MAFLILFTHFFLFTLIISLFFPSSKLLLFLHSLLLSTKTPTKVLKKQSLPHPPNLNTLFSTIDVDFLRRLGLHDSDTDLKSLDNEEFKELFFSGEEVEEELREAFEVFDGNGDGMIIVEELGLVLKSFGMREGDCVENCREMINRVDLDGDGMVNFQEFKRMMVGDREGKIF